MREPTPQRELYAFWMLNLKALGCTKITTEPQSGFYRCKLVKGGPWVPVAIWVHQETDEAGELLSDETLQCLVDGKPHDAAQIWSYCADKPIAEDEYRFRIEYGRWARDWAPETPAAQPKQALDPNTAAPVF